MIHEQVLKLTNSFRRNIRPLAHLAIDLHLFQVYTPKVNAINLGENPNFASGHLVARNVFDTDDFVQSIPETWVTSKKGNGIERVTSYFTSIQEDQGVHFDLTTFENDEFYIAVVPSVGAVNPLTGLNAHCDMRQYRTHCPRHNTEFIHDRYCSRCEFVWPKQNYIATTGTPIGHFCLPGCFCDKLGMHRLLFSSRTHMVPLCLIFYRSKEVRWDSPAFARGKENIFANKRAHNILGMHLNNEARLYDDPNDLSFWNPVPVGMVVLHTATEDEVARILGH